VRPGGRKPPRRQNGQGRFGGVVQLSQWKAAPGSTRRYGVMLGLSERPEGSRPRRRGTALGEWNSSRGVWLRGRRMASGGDPHFGEERESEASRRETWSTSCPVAGRNKPASNVWSKPSKSCETARAEQDSGCLAAARRSDRFRFGVGVDTRRYVGGEGTRGGTDEGTMRIVRSGKVTTKEMGKPVKDDKRRVQKTRWMVWGKPRRPVR
jgi:hypothetical protein